MKRISKDEVEAMYKNEKQRSVELVFYNQGLKKSIGIRKPTTEFLKEFDEEQDQSATSENFKENK